MKWLATAVLGHTTRPTPCPRPARTADLTASPLDDDRSSWHVEICGGDFCDIVGRHRARLLQPVVSRSHTITIGVRRAREPCNQTRHRRQTASGTGHFELF